MASIYNWFHQGKLNFDHMTTDQLLEAIELINNRPLKLNNYFTDVKIFRTCSNENCNLPLIMSYFL